MEIEHHSKIVINRFNKRISVSCSIRILMEDILKLSEDLNIYSHHHVYKEVNRIVNCIAKKDISIIHSRILAS